MASRNRVKPSDGAAPGRYRKSTGRREPIALGAERERHLAAALEFTGLASVRRERERLVREIGRVMVVSIVVIIIWFIKIPFLSFSFLSLLSL